MQPANRIDRLMTTVRPWLTDGGLETDLIFNRGQELPLFASFVMLQTPEGRAIQKDYFNQYLHLAAAGRTGFVLDTNTWRAGFGWGAKLGFSADQMAEINKDAVRFIAEIREQWEKRGLPIILNGVVGPSGDGYIAGDAKTANEAYIVHAPQIRALAEAGADMISAITMTYPEEAIGIARAAIDAGKPVVVSFTVETDGKLPSGDTIAEAIDRTDSEVEEATGEKPLYYMINCAHPDHFSGALTGDEDWRYRIGGVRANASRLSHAELDEAETLDDGNPQEFGALYAQLAALLPNLRVIGGCCGTDHRHVDCACQSLTKRAAA